MLSGEFSSLLVTILSVRVELTWCSRRVAWNSTLLLSGIFGILAGAMPNFVSFVSLFSNSLCF